MNDYERKATNECVEPVLMAVGQVAIRAALELPPRDEEEPFATEENT